MQSNVMTDQCIILNTSRKNDFTKYTCVYCFHRWSAAEQCLVSHSAQLTHSFWSEASTTRIIKTNIAGISLKVPQVWVVIKFSIMVQLHGNKPIYLSYTNLLIGDSYEWQLLAQLPNPKSSFYSICVTSNGIMLTGRFPNFLPFYVQTYMHT